MKKYRVVVVGGGAAGIVTAMGAASMGFSTALIENNRIGGECSWTGCVPSKALLAAAKEAHRISTADQWGLSVSGTTDTSGVMAKVRDLRQRTAERAQTKSLLEKAGVEVIFGAPRFVSASEIDVEGLRIEGKDIVISTGSAPVHSKGIGLENVKYYTNQEIFEIEAVPESMGIIGGGPIGIEMAQAFQRLGSKVTVFHAGPAILPKDDPELTEQLANILRRQGVEIYLNSRVENITQEGGHITVATSGDTGESRGKTVSVLLVAMGRQANVEGLDLEKIGVKYTPKGIAVNGYLQTTVPHIWACGDCIGKYQFSHIAEVEARQVLQNILLPVKRPVNYAGIPWATFTDPELAHVGLTEREAQEQGIAHQVYRQSMGLIDRAIVEQEDQGMIKIVADPGGKILGAHILATNAAEMLNELVVAVNSGVGLTRISSLPHVYPSWGYAIQRSADHWLMDLGKRWYVKFGLGILRRFFC